MAKRIMRSFKLNEISGVDSPAQKGAVVAIIKREFSADQRYADAASGAAMPDGSFPINSAGDVANAVNDWGRAGSKADVKAHIISRAKTLGATDKLPDGWVAKHAGLSGDPPDNNGDPMSDVTKQIETLNAQIAALTTASTAAIAKAADLEAKLAAEITKAQNIAKMSAAHTAYAGNPKATLPKGGKDAFAAMTPAQRDAHISDNPIGGEPDGDEAAKFARAVAKAAAEDEVLKVGGIEVRKSAVGADNFAIFKAQQEEITKANDARELVELQKRAETDLGNLPGEIVAKAKVLKAITKMDEADRKTLDALLKAGNAAMKDRLREVGKGGDASDSADDKLEALAKAHAKEHKIDYYTAYAAVLDSPDGREIYKSRRAK